MQEKDNTLVETVFEIEPLGYLPKSVLEVVEDNYLVVSRRKERLSMHQQADAVAVFTEGQVQEILVGVMDQVLSQIGWNAEGWTHEFVDDDLQ